MASNPLRLPQRRTLAQRVKGDENAMARHTRQPSSGTNPTNARFSMKENAIKQSANSAIGPQRVALGEVTTHAVNRNQEGSKAGKGKEEVGLKRSRPHSSSVSQRVPTGPGRLQQAQVAPPVTNVINTRVVTGPVRVPVPGARRISRSSTDAAQGTDARDEAAIEMEIEGFETRDAEEEVNEREVAAMIGLEESDEEQEEVEPVSEPAAKAAPSWPEFSSEQAHKFQKEIEAIKQHFEDEVDIYDTTMVSEYAEEIFEYMCELEDEVMPNPDYMDGQSELTWAMRQTLVDWLLQVHLRYHMLPETLWIAVNIVDRFLTKRVVSLLKLQLVGVTAMFVAAKYEEILAPSVEEFVFMTDNGYTREEILKGERIMLQTLEFRISNYCSPYSWMRKISKADDYDIQTRTLSKFLTEVTLLDHRFLRAKPSLVAAVGMYSARRMLGGDWNEAFIFYSGYTEAQLLPGHELLVDKLAEDNFSRQYVCKKYANKKFLKASLFAIDWAKSQSSSSTTDSMHFAD